MEQMIKFKKRQNVHKTLSILNKFVCERSDKEKIVFA